MARLGIATLWIIRIFAMVVGLQQLGANHSDPQVMTALIGYLCVCGLGIPSFFEYLSIAFPLAFARPTLLCLFPGPDPELVQQSLFQHTLILALGGCITFTVHSDCRRDWLRSSSAATQPAPPDRPRRHTHSASRPGDSVGSNFAAAAAAAAAADPASAAADAADAGSRDGPDDESAEADRRDPAALEVMSAAAGGGSGPPRRARRGPAVSVGSPPPTRRCVGRRLRARGCCREPGPPPPSLSPASSLSPTIGQRGERGGDAARVRGIGLACTRLGGSPSLDARVRTPNPDAISARVRGIGLARRGPCE